MIKDLDEMAWRVATNQKEWKPGGKLKLWTRIKLKINRKDKMENDRKRRR